MCSTEPKYWTCPVFFPARHRTHSASMAKRAKSICPTSRPTSTGGPRNRNQARSTCRIRTIAIGHRSVWISISRSRTEWAMRTRNRFRVIGRRADGDLIRQIRECQGSLREAMSSFGYARYNDSLTICITSNPVRSTFRVAGWRELVRRVMLSPQWWGPIRNDWQKCGAVLSKFSSCNPTMLVKPMEEWGSSRPLWSCRKELESSPATVLPVIAYGASICWLPDAGLPRWVKTGLAMRNRLQLCDNVTIAEPREWVETGFGGTLVGVRALEFLDSNAPDVLSDYLGKRCGADAVLKVYANHGVAPMESWCEVFTHFGKQIGVEG
jgi:hypothetical protein